MSQNTPTNINKEDIVKYFSIYGIRVDCQINHSQSQYHGWVSELKIYCPSKYSKESLTDSAHIIGGYYIEFTDPYNTPFVKVREYILEPSCTENQLFNLRDLKVYFTRLAMTKGLDIKPQFGHQKYISSNQPVQFQILAATREEAKTLSKMSHDCGSVVFQLIIVKKPLKTKENSKTISATDSKSISVSNPSPSKPKSKVESTLVKPLDNMAPSLIQVKESINKTAEGGFQDPAISYKSSSLLTDPKSSKNLESKKTLQKVAPSLQSSHILQETNPLPQADLLGGQSYPKRPHNQYEICGNYAQNEERTSLNMQNHLEYYEEPHWDQTQYWDQRIPDLNKVPQNTYRGQNTAEVYQQPIRQIRQAEAKQKNHFSDLKNYYQQEEFKQEVHNTQLQPLYGQSENISEYGWSAQSQSNYPYENKNVTLRGSVSDASSSNQQTSRSKKHINNGDSISRSTQYYPTSNYRDQENHEILSELSYPEEPRLSEVHSQSQASMSINMKQTSSLSAEIRQTGIQKSMKIVQNNTINEPIDHTFGSTISMTVNSNDLQSPSMVVSSKVERKKTPKDKDGNKKDKSEKSKVKKETKESQEKDYSTLLQICYWPIYELSEAWIKRIYKLSKKLKAMPHSMFQNNTQDLENKERVSFADIRELHPLGKFLKKSQQETSPLDCSDDEIQPPKYDRNEFVSLGFGERHFGGLFVPKEYNMWRGVSEKVQEALVGSVSRGRLGMIDPDSSFDTKTSILMKTHDDVLLMGRCFREAHQATQRRVLGSKASEDLSRQVNGEGIFDEFSFCEDGQGVSTPVQEKGYYNSRSANTETASQQ